MRLGAAVYTYLWTCSLDHAIERVASLGFTDLEVMTTSPHVAPQHFGAYDRQRLRRKLVDADLRLVALNPTFLDLNLASMNADVRELSVLEVRANIRLAHDLGAEIVVVAPGRRHPLIPAPFDDVWDVALTSMSQCLKTAEECGVLVGIEPIPSLFVQRASDAVRMLRELDSSYGALVYDVANAQMVESPVEGLVDSLPYLRHLHFSDTERNHWGHLPIGDGDINFKEIIAELGKHPYAGTTILEVIDQRDPDGALRRSRDALIANGWTV
jgi:sugar phosphate isomerase/epimerase